MKKLFLMTILFFSISTSHSMELDLDNQNEALSDLAVMFYSEKNDPVYQFETLNPEKLDYSIESLKLIDTYLSGFRKTNLDQISHDQRFKTILRTGAYVGEVIRKNDKNRQWYWVDYETAKEINPDFFKDKDHSIGLAAVLTDGESFIFPLNKVVKFLQNGEEDSVHFFATVTLKS
ncbi:hypothetical protein F991_02674 [Acinetobacter sp. CIP-A165]|uniref:hypothetical protein n=1 Tax=Acinetobacter sp. CIP-A165 TaxID=40373 RepID=UPI0002CE5CF3|nr:hypothetical protein [Acinetobacter sp. CIP-A165]ENU29443.1 hypothetical protein F991_02674 [Acinetobacter sp. CIP-A165]